MPTRGQQGGVNEGSKLGMRPLGTEKLWPEWAGPHSQTTKEDIYYKQTGITTDCTCLKKQGAMVRVLGHLPDDITFSAKLRQWGLRAWIKSAEVEEVSNQRRASALEMHWVAAAQDIGEVGVLRKGSHTQEVGFDSVAGGPMGGLKARITLIRK